MDLQGEVDAGRRLGCGADELQQVWLAVLDGEGVLVGTLLGLHSLGHQLPSHRQVVVVVALEDERALLVRDLCRLLLGLSADCLCEAEDREGLGEEGLL